VCFSVRNEQVDDGASSSSWNVILHQLHNVLKCENSSFDAANFLQKKKGKRTKLQSFTISYLFVCFTSSTISQFWATEKSGHNTFLLEFLFGKYTKLLLLVKKHFPGLSLDPQLCLQTFSKKEQKIWIFYYQNKKIKAKNFLLFLMNTRLIFF
jgi:hypothetical protein